MSEHMPTPERVTEHAEAIPGSTYGTGAAAASPMTLDDAGAAQGLGVAHTEEDQEAVREAAFILPEQADDTVTAGRKRLGELPLMRPCSGHPDGTPNTEYGTAATASWANPGWRDDGRKR